MNPVVVSIHQSCKQKLMIVECFESRGVENSPFHSASSPCGPSAARSRTSDMQCQRTKSFVHDTNSLLHPHPLIFQTRQIHMDKTRQKSDSSLRAVHGKRTHFSDIHSSRNDLRRGERPKCSSYRGQRSSAPRSEIPLPDFEPRRMLRLDRTMAFWQNDYQLSSGTLFPLAHV